jgi:chemotaxis protein MotB
MMITSKRGVLMVARKSAWLGLLLAVFLLAGCSCKKFEQQIAQMDEQIADLQTQVADKDATITEANQIATGLRSDLQKCQADKAVLVEQINEVVMIRIPDKILFASSSVMVLDTMVPTLEAIAAQIRQHPTWDAYVEGYTDNKKILEDWQEKWPSNWELGAARSCAVVRYMTNQLDLPAERFAAVSYGPFRPVGDNATPAGRDQNRFVQVVMHKPSR